MCEYFVCGYQRNYDDDEKLFPTLRVVLLPASLLLKIPVSLLLLRLTGGR